MQINSKVIKNILVVRNDRFGEFLLNIPAMRALKETFTDANLIAVVSPYVKELAGAVPFIDEIVEWQDKKHSLLQRLKLLALIKKKNIDMAIMLNPSNEFNILTFLAGIPIRVGYDRKCGFLLTLKMKDEKYLGEKHEVEYNLDLVRLVGAQTGEFPFSLKIDDNISILDNSVAIHPFTSDPIKQWPLENFRELAKKISQYYNYPVIIMGGPDIANEIKESFSSLDKNLINMIGKTTLIELGSLLRKCKLLISADSGPVHLACAVGTPVLAIFRNDIRAKCAKRWGPWGKGNSVIKKNNLLDIKTEEVFEKFKEMVNK